MRWVGRTGLLTGQKEPVKTEANIQSPRHYNKARGTQQGRESFRWTVDEKMLPEGVGGSETASDV